VDLGYAHTWNDQFTTNVGVGQIAFPKDDDLGMAKYKVTEFFLNTTWNITKNCQFGAEYFDSTIKYKDVDNFFKDNGTHTDKAHNNGFNLMFTYNFF